MLFTQASAILIPDTVIRILTMDPMAIHITEATMDMDIGAPRNIIGAYK